jgi:hypothetical protein
MAESNIKVDRGLYEMCKAEYDEYMDQMDAVLAKPIKNGDSTYEDEPFKIWEDK